MKYSLEQKDEIKSTIFRIRLKRHELEELVDEVNDIFYRFITQKKNVCLKFPLQD
ncbi:TPA: hypothetical protein IVY68_002279 [Enterococcus faecium]|nr:hypothetical protein [Enterococcus faecium]HAP7964165.1 hypothetical protein [Enterococcus faecium]HAP8102312.1 hypothetical protein [Enterococcus faecium]HAV0110868.1 hypothetical protein [Enterococcus faecium]